jgi:ribosomal protein L40E
MKKAFCAGFVLIAVMSLFGCRVDMELWIDNKGGGTGNVTVLGAPMLGANEFRSQLEKKGITVVSLDQKALGNMVAKIRWDDFNRGIGRRQAIDNGLFLLDFGKVEMGSLTVHVDGKIVQEKTTGKLRDATTVVFQHGRANMVYLPNKPAPFPAVAVIAVVFIVIVGGIVLLKSRRESQAQLPATSPVPHQVAETSAQPSDLKFCTQCGAERPEEHQFCTKCGNKFN